MQNPTQSGPRSWLAPFCCVLLVIGICEWGHAQRPNTGEARFGKIQLQDALQSDEASKTDSAGADFYEKYIKGKTVLINFFYAKCDQGVCDQVMSKLARVQQLLGDRVGRDRFIISITLASTDDTAEALRTYARGIKAKPGWSFLRGKVEEIDDLSNRLGLGKVSPEFLRSLNAVSPEVAEAGKTIEAKSPTEWAPKSLRALVGDRVVWKIGGASAGKHGLQITNWAVVKQFVEVESVEGQEPFNVTTGRNDGSAETAGKVLVRLKIKSEPSVPTKITYNCTVQGKAMAGEVSLGQQHTGMLLAYSDRTKRHSFISFDATPTEIQATLADLEGSVLPAITIDAGPGVAWRSGGNASTPQAPLKVAAKKGQTLVFRQAETNPLRPHGIFFTTPTLVLLKGDDPAKKPNAVLKQTDSFGLYGTDVGGAAAPQELARFEVIQDIATAPAFQCTVHVAAMAGSVEPVPPGGSAKALPTAEEKFLSDLTPSMQRRLLDFVNRAYTPEDLMRSPQEIRMKSEHLPPNAQGSKSDAKGGFPRNVAVSLIARRPLDGYRDVRECLPSYKESGGLESLGGVLDSLGARQFGRWDEVASNVPPVMHAAMLHTGKVLFLTDSTDTALWDPAGRLEVLPGATTGLGNILFCSGHSFLSDGRLLAVGGGGSGAADAVSTGWKFDPVSTKWSPTSNRMAFQRWYPSLVTLGRKPEQVLVAAGLTRSGFPATQMEVYSEATDRFELVNATGPAGDLLFPGTYPSLRVLPGGEILHVATGWGVTERPCNQSPDGAAVEPTAIFTFSSPSTGSWRTLGGNHRLKGMSVTLFEFPSLQSLVVGGGSAAQSATAATMNLSTISPKWEAFPLLEARVHPNLVVLPDGTVFICGGKESSAPTPPDGGRCELFDPRPGAPTLTEMDAMTRFRHYHSVALLLPDGRVMAAGGAARGGCTVSVQNTIEVFSPPYLFRGPRPVISSATKVVEHGGAIEIKTPAASEIRRVVLARPAAVTHQTDSEQRVLPLSFRVTGPDTIEAISPGGPGANPLAPRGHYMLFILNQDGVPSVSEWVFVGAMAGSVEPVPPGGSAALPAITIDAGPGVAWRSGGNASTPQAPLKVAAKKGQTLVFRQAETNPLRPHGIFFTTPTLVLLKGDDPAKKPNAVLKQTDSFGLYGTDVGGAAAPQELARFEVIQDIATAPAFQCTVHVAAMAGSVEQATASKMVAIPLEDAMSVDPRAARLKAVPSQVEMEVLNRKRAREVKLIDKNGKPRSLREFAGRPHIVVLIKGAFCKHCMAQLAEFQRQLEPSKVPVVVVTPVDDLKELGDIPFAVFADPEFNLFKSLQAFRDEPLHGTFVFNSRDEILLKDIGSEPYTDVAAIKAALK